MYRKTSLIFVLLLLIVFISCNQDAHFSEDVERVTSGKTTSTDGLEENISSGTEISKNSDIFSTAIVAYKDGELTITYPEQLQSAFTLENEYGTYSRIFFPTHTNGVFITGVASLSSGLNEDCCFIYHIPSDQFYISEYNIPRTEALLLPNNRFASNVRYTNDFEPYRGYNETSFASRDDYLSGMYTIYNEDLSMSDTQINFPHDIILLNNDFQIFNYAFHTMGYVADSEEYFLLYSENGVGADFSTMPILMMWFGSDGNPISEEITITDSDDHIFFSKGHYGGDLFQLADNLFVSTSCINGSNRSAVLVNAQSHMASVIEPDELENILSIYGGVFTNIYANTSVFRTPQQPPFRIIEGDSSDTIHMVLKDQSFVSLPRDFLLSCWAWDDKNSFTAIFSTFETRSEEESTALEEIVLRSQYWDFRSRAGKPATDHFPTPSQSLSYLLGEPTSYGYTEKTIQYYSKDSEELFLALFPESELPPPEPFDKIKTDLKYPQFYGLPNRETQNILNETISGNFPEDVNSVKDNFILENEYHISCSSDMMISILSTGAYLNVAGPRIQPFNFAITMNLETGELLELEDMS